MERLAQLQDGGTEVRRSLRRAGHPAQGSARDARRALRSHSVQGLRGVPQPVRAGGLQREAVDLSLLLHAKPLSPALRVHQRDQPPRRAVPHLHHHRVPAPEARRVAAGVHVRGGRVPHRGGTLGTEAVPDAGAVAAARERVRGSDHVRDARARPRARFRRVPQIVRVPRVQGVHVAADPGSAFPIDRRSEAEARAADERRRGHRPPVQVPGAPRRLRVSAHVRARGAVQGFFQRPARLPAGEMHGNRGGGGRDAARLVRLQHPRSCDAVRGWSRDRRRRPGCG
mmetsp:Transcript_4506/g.18523  ORF Transcript_4506/g.18523 Transcript_4506/m.18523 type:complete len:284 (-) Transcript_4506:1468-2319(-)